MIGTVTGKRILLTTILSIRSIKIQPARIATMVIHQGGSGISTIGAIIATIGGFFGACAILTLLGGGDDISIIAVIILWAICGTGLGAWFEKIGF